MKITISNEILSVLPDFTIIPYTMDVVNIKTNVVQNLLTNLNVDFNINEVTTNLKIKETRDGYKKLGKDPSHTRCAVEALVRRVIKHHSENKEAIYSLGDLVDLGNILSVETLRSVCVVDLEKIKNDVLIRVGKPNELVEAINRNNINAENLIVYTDDEGIFGSPTSDTLRTAINKFTKKILVMIICFSRVDLKEDEEKLINLYSTYAKATNLKKIEVKEGK